jgi:hypothetical protein
MARMMFVFWCGRQSSRLSGIARHMLAVFAAIEELPDDDPPGTEAEFMRGIDENRPADRKIFEGLGLY